MTTDDAYPSVPGDRITAEDLLASPRGSSLVFGLVQRGRDDEFYEWIEPLTAEARALAEFRRAADVAGSDIDSAEGISSTVYMRAVPDSEPEPEPESEPEDVTPADVADMLRLVTPVTPTQGMLEDLMAEVVTFAMYWQPPLGNDQIASAPEVREALRPFAEALISTGLLDDWAAPLDPGNQWALAWDDADHCGGLPAVFDRHLGTIASTETAAITLTDLCQPRREDVMWPPWGLEEWLADVLTTETEYRHELAKNPYAEVSGEWSSTPPVGLWSSTGTWRCGTPIGVELVEDDFGLERARACRLRARPGVRVAEIRRPEDWADLCRRYPVDVTAQRRQVWFEATGRKGRWVIPDWSRVAEEFDGVHVGLTGYLWTAGAVIAVTEGRLGEDSGTVPTAGNTDDRTASLMAGWHPDTTFWLNDVIDTVTEVAEWRYDDDVDRWVRD